MIVAVHQPQYLPWLGYFDKMLRADVFCYLDNVQFKKNEWQNRNRIKSSQQWIWLTVPVKYRFPQKMNEVAVDNATKWGKKHLQSLSANYGKAPFFKEYISDLAEVIERNWETISDLNIEMIEKIRKAIGLSDKKTVVASKMSLSSDPTDRLIDICLSVGADTYLSGIDGAKYMDLDRFKEKGIEVKFQEYTHPTYPQLHGEFMSHLSVVDLLFNCGPDCLNIIQSGHPAMHSAEY